MPTRRTPRKLNFRAQITPRAVEAFRKLIKLDPDDPEWLECEHIIARELRCKPWEFYCVMSPDEKPQNYWDRVAQKRWEQLAACL